MNTIGIWNIVESRPKRIQPAEIAYEEHLEDWIEADPALLEQGLVVVGRQLRLEGGPLDLLALDPQGRWVLIEIKRERLRREVIAQAIDYASCLHRLKAERLRMECDAYLRSKGSATTLDELLSDRGRSLSSEAEAKEIVIYLVGTGLDAGLERMVDYLAERANLSVRMVTFTPFRDAAGAQFLAREIHESTDMPAVGEHVVSPSPAPEAILSLADSNGVGAVVRKLYDTAAELGLHARPWAKSIMFAPPANKTRCLFVVWVERRQKEPGVAKAFIAAEAFDQFYGIKESELVAAVGQVGYVMLNKDDAEQLSTALRQLLSIRT